MTPKAKVASNELPPNASVRVIDTWLIEDFPETEIVQFESVFWEPDDTKSMRELLRTTSLEGTQVLEIGVGTGLLSFCCLKAGAKYVVGTDINPSAIACATYNADRLGLEGSLDLRLVSPQSPGAFSVIEADETFDLIISNPPWEKGVPRNPADHAYYDPGFALLQSLIEGLDRHLAPGGRCLLAHGGKAAVVETRRMAELHGYSFNVLDPRELDGLPDVFLPGMMLELRKRD